MPPFPASPSCLASCTAFLQPACTYCMSAACFTPSPSLPFLSAIALWFFAGMPFYLWLPAAPTLQRAYSTHHVVAFATAFTQPHHLHTYLLQFFVYIWFLQFYVYLPFPFLPLYVGLHFVVILQYLHGPVPSLDTLFHYMGWFLASFQLRFLLCGLLQFAAMHILPATSYTMLLHCGSTAFQHTCGSSPHLCVHTTPLPHTTHTHTFTTHTHTLPLDHHHTHNTHHRTHTFSVCFSSTTFPGSCLPTHTLVTTMVPPPACRRILHSLLLPVFMQPISSCLDPSFPFLLPAYHCGFMQLHTFPFFLGPLVVCSRLYLPVLGSYIQPV